MDSPHPNSVSLTKEGKAFIEFVTKLGTKVAGNMDSPFESSCHNEGLRLVYVQHIDILAEKERFARDGMDGVHFDTIQTHPRTRVWREHAS